VVEESPIDHVGWFKVIPVMPKNNTNSNAAIEV